MNKRRFLVLFALLLLVTGVTACERSLDTSGGATPTAAATGGAIPGTSDVMGQLVMSATQTALAASGQPQPQPTTGGTNPQETPAAPGGTETAPQATTQPGEEAQPTATSAPAQPTATMVTVPTSTPGLPSTYTLQKGESPYCIARRFDVDPGELLRLSGLGANQLFYAGTELKIPQGGKEFPGNRSLRNHPTTYTVDAGETINSIACLFGDVDPNAIAFANGLESPYRLKAGQTLQIP